MDWIHNEAGFRIGINDQANLIFGINPEEIPIDPPGICVFEGSFPDYSFSLRSSFGEFTLGGEFVLQDQINEDFFPGDSLLNLSNIMSNRVSKYDTEFLISLVPNSKGRIGRIIVEGSNENWSYEQTNIYLFAIASEVLNNLSVSYSIPVSFTYFVILHKNHCFYSVVNKKPGVKNFEGVFLEPQCDWDLWHIASGHYRKSWLSSNPIEQFLNLYLAIEGIISVIKKELNLNHISEGPIIHANWTEPIMQKHFSINKDPRFPQLLGMKFYDILFTNNGFRIMRNEAAHVILRSGSFRSNTNLNDYLDYQAAIPYLNSIFQSYLERLVTITDRSGERANDR